MYYTPDKLIKSWLSEVASKDNVIVDVGCGDGRFVKDLIASGYTRVAGADILANSNDPETDEKILAENFPFYLTYEQFPFESNGVDFITCNQVFEHVEYKHKFLAEL